jgi:hypothetical protein
VKKSWLRIAAGVALFVFVGWFALFLWAFRPRSNHVRIANESGVTVGDVRLLVLNLNDRAVVLDERVKELSAGASATFEHRCNDSTPSLSFVLDGDRKTFDEPYVDLWTGQGWLSSIQPQGVVTSAYDE